MATGQCIHTLYGHPRTPWVVRWHPTDRNVLATGSLNAEVRVWNLATGSCVESRRFSTCWGGVWNGVMCGISVRDGNTRSQITQPHVYTVVHTFTLHTHTGRPIASLAFMPTNPDILAIASGHKVCVLHAHPISPHPSTPPPHLNTPPRSSTCGITPTHPRKQPRCLGPAGPCGRCIFTHRGPP